MVSADIGGFLRNDLALQYMLAGNCTVTLVSKKTKAMITCKLKKIKSKRADGNEFIYLLNVPDGSKSIYAGVVYFNASGDKFEFSTGVKGQVQESDIRVKSVLYVINKLLAEKYDLEVEVYHSGKCGRCNKKLTVPDSIVTGLGPECSRLLNIPRIKVR